MAIALVTGSSSGFGLLTAVALGRAGFHVIASMRSLERRQALEEAARAASVSLDIFPLDVTDAAARRAVARRCDELGGCDVLVNNAGFGLAGFAHDVSLDEYREQLETNFFAAVALTKEVLPSMLRRRGGRIINVSSINGRFAVPGLSAYAASKFALEGFTESLRLETAPLGVWPILVEPGTFKTDIFDRNRREAKAMRDPASPHHAQLVALEKLLEALLTRSRADPRRVAEVIVKAATARHPRLRYLVGADARIEAYAKDLLPGSWLEALILRVTRAR